MAETKLENIGNFDFEGGSVRIRTFSPAVDQTITIPASSGYDNTTFRDIITYLNTQFTEVAINIDDYENVTIVPDVVSNKIITVEVSGNNYLAYGLGVVNKLSSASISLDTGLINVSTYTFPYFSGFQLPAYVESLNNVVSFKMGFEKREALRKSRAGKDYIAFDGIESTPYQVINGWKFHYTIEEVRFPEMDMWMALARENDIQWVNDTFGIDEGKTYNILIHEDDTVDEVINYLDIYKRYIVALKKEDLSAI